MSALLDRVVKGEVIQKTRRGKPIAELRPVAENQIIKPRFGSEKDLICFMSNDFNEPLEDFGDYSPD